MPIHDLSKTDHPSINPFVAIARNEEMLAMMANIPAGSAIAVTEISRETQDHIDQLKAMITRLGLTPTSVVEFDNGEIIRVVPTNNQEVMNHMIENRTVTFREGGYIAQRRFYYTCIICGQKSSAERAITVDAATKKRYTWLDCGHLHDLDRTTEDIVSETTPLPVQPELTHIPKPTPTKEVPMSYTAETLTIIEGVLHRKSSTKDQLSQALTSAITLIRHLDMEVQKMESNKPLSVDSLKERVDELRDANSDKPLNTNPGMVKAVTMTCNATNHAPGCKGKVTLTGNDNYISTQKKILADRGGLFTPCFNAFGKPPVKTAKVKVYHIHCIGWKEDPKTHRKTQCAAPISGTPTELGARKNLCDSCFDEKHSY